jgi:hypothetical protein
MVFSAEKKQNLAPTLFSISIKNLKPVAFIPFIPSPHPTPSSKQNLQQNQ